MRVTVDLDKKHKVRGPLRYADYDFSNYRICTEQDEKGVSIIVHPKGGPVTGVIMEMPSKTANRLAHMILSVAPDRQKRTSSLSVDESTSKARAQQK